MTKQIKAFPWGDGEFLEPNYGMDLRDYIATAALQGYLSNPNLTLKNGHELSINCYEIADAMMKERVK